MLNPNFFSEKIRKLMDRYFLCSCSSLQTRTACQVNMKELINFKLRSLCSVALVLPSKPQSHWLESKKAHVNLASCQDRICFEGTVTKLSIHFALKTQNE